MASLFDGDFFASPIDFRKTTLDPVFEKEGTAAESVWVAGSRLGLLASAALSAALFLGAAANLSDHKGSSKSWTSTVQSVTSTAPPADADAVPELLRVTKRTVEALASLHGRSPGAAAMSATYSEDEASLLF